MHYTPHVPKVDIPLAQSLNMRCASRKGFVKICQENSNAAIQAGRTDVAQVLSLFFLVGTLFFFVLTWRRYSLFHSILALF